MMSTLSVVWENLWGQTNLNSCCSDLCSLRIERATKKKYNNNQRGTGQIKSLIWKLLENTRQNSQSQKTCTPARMTYKSISHVLGRKLYTEHYRGPELHFHTAVSRLIRHDNFVNSGLCSSSPTWWSCDTRRKRSSKVISSGVKKLFGEETVRSTLDPDGQMNTRPWTRTTWSGHFERAHDGGRIIMTFDPKIKIFP